MLTAIKITISRYIDDHQPGFVECLLRDAQGQEHRFHEKVPIVTCDDLTAESSYPRPGEIACEVIQKKQDEHGRTIVTICTERPWGCESILGITQFEILPEQLVTIEP